MHPPPNFHAKTVLEEWSLENTVISHRNRLYIAEKLVHYMLSLTVLLQCRDFSLLDTLLLVSKVISLSVSLTLQVSLTLTSF